MSTEFRVDFAPIHTGAESCGEDSLRLEAYRRYVKYELIPGLVKQYKSAHPDISWGDAYLAVRKAHIEYIGTLFPRKGIEVNPFPGEDFVSTQAPVLDDEDKFHSCYRRDEVGLPAFRKHTLTFNGKGIGRWFHHSSPVPYEVTDKHERREKTIRNLRQLAAQDPDKPIAEVRLLSPLDGLKAKAASPFAHKYFTELNDYEQLLETAVAAELSGLDITLFNFGVNSGRYLTNELQTLLNVRALKKLHAKITGDKPPQSFTLDPSDPQIEKTFLEQLKKQNSGDYQTLPQNIDASNATEEQKKLYRKLMQLLSTGEWKKNNFYAQAILVVLLYSFDFLTATGCNDAKDRDGNLTNMIEALLISLHKPELKLGDILKTVQQHSSAARVAEMVSMPGLAKGLDHSANPNRKAARMFKLIYTEHQHEAFKKRDGQTHHTEQPLQLVFVHEEKPKGIWRSLAAAFRKIGEALKSLGNAISTVFWGILLAVGIATTASASTDIVKDGVSSPDASGAYVAVVSTEDGFSQVPQPQPVQKREDDTTAQEGRAESDDEATHSDADEDDTYDTYSLGTSPSESPVLSRKSGSESPNESPRVKSWAEVRAQHPGHLSAVDAIAKMGLINSKSPPKPKPLSLSEYSKKYNDSTSLDTTRRHTF